MNKPLICTILLLGTALMAVGSQTAPKAEEPTKITVTGLRSDNGRILWSLRDTNAQVWVGMAQPQKGVAAFEIAKIRTDSAVLDLFHDENNNYRLDLLKNGKPAEGVISCTIRRKELGDDLRLQLSYEPGSESPAPSRKR